MKQRRKEKLEVLGLYVAALILVGVVGSFFSLWISPKPVKVGATFSEVYAVDLGLEWQDVYLAMLDELQVESVRIPVYWSEIESVRDEPNFSDIDWMMDQAAQRGVEVTLAIGVKVPRWPECHIPEWLDDESKEVSEQQLFEFLHETITRYRGHSALERWQLENEAYFPFGHCPMPDPHRLESERELVETLDPHHPLQLTTSGEQAFWVPTAIPADVLGVSLYRITYNGVIGYIIFPHRPILYAIQQTVASLFTDKVIISELQVEPWFPDSVEWTLNEQYEAFDVKDLQNNIWFAKRTRASEVFLWGVEWWYYLREQGDARLWDAGLVEIQQMKSYGF